MIEFVPGKYYLVELYPAKSMITSFQAAMNGFAWEEGPAVICDVIYTLKYANVEKTSMLVGVLFSNPKSPHDLVVYKVQTKTGLETTGLVRNVTEIDEKEVNGLLFKLKLMYPEGKMNGYKGVDYNKKVFDKMKDRIVTPEPEKEKVAKTSKRRKLNVKW